MTTKTLLAEKLLKAYRRSMEAPKCFIGFDGFTDEIIEAVDTRNNVTDYRPMTTMEQFGRRILKFAGKSCNIELVVREKKIGGNAPILTNALLEGGHRITFAGAIGTPDEIEPLFKKMAQRCEQVFPLCPSGHSDALEFHDGKIILGKHASLIDINYTSLLDHIDAKTLTQILDDADLFVSANWTMLPLMTGLWQRILDEIVPCFQREHLRWFFVDLADPAKRTDEALVACLQALKQFGNAYRVILGLNEAEALRIGKVLGSSLPSGDIDKVEALARDIQQRSGLYQVVIHATRFAVAANDAETVSVLGPYTPKPVLTTGAGDNFNAGFCNALLCQLTTEETLLSGVATSGFYVRNGHSPTMQELAVFLNSW